MPVELKFGETCLPVGPCWEFRLRRMGFAFIDQLEKLDNAVFEWWTYLRYTSLTGPRLSEAQRCADIPGS